MSTPHDFGYWFGFTLALVILLGVPTLVILGLFDFWRRMAPVMESILGLFFHLHRRT
jgi:hypothetical protein